MKKIVFILFVVTIFYFISISNNEKLIIPDESIRFRIIANSNSYSDQELKWNINKELIPSLISIMDSSNNINIARENINNNLLKIERIVSKYTDNYSINFGQNYFPLKEYKNISYKEGNYESLVITLGEGSGDNWWCVLFPPLCLMEATSNDYDDVVYTSYFKTIINKYQN